MTQTRLIAFERVGNLSPLALDDTHSLMDGHRQGGLSAGGAITCRVCGRLNYTEGPSCSVCSQTRRVPIPSGSTTALPRAPALGKATSGSHDTRVDRRTIATASLVAVKAKHSSVSSPTASRTSDWHHSSSGRQTSSSSSHRHSTASDLSRSLASPRQSYRSGERSSSSTSRRSPERRSRSRSRSRPRSTQSRSRSNSRSRGRKDQQQSSKRDDTGMPPRSTYSKHKSSDKAKAAALSEPTRPASNGTARAAPAVIPAAPAASSVAANKRPRDEDVIDLISDSEDEDETLPAVSVIKRAKPSSSASETSSTDAAAPADKAPNAAAGRKRPLPSSMQSGKPETKGQSAEVANADDSDMSDEDLGAYRGRMFDEREFNVNDFPTGEEYSSAKERAIAARKPKATKRETPTSNGQAGATATAAAASLPVTSVAKVDPVASTITAGNVSQPTSAPPASIPRSDAVKASAGLVPPSSSASSLPVAPAVSAPVPGTKTTVVVSSPPDQIPSDQASALEPVPTALAPDTQAPAEKTTQQEIVGGSTSQDTTAASAPRSRLSFRHDGNCQDQPIELSDDDDDDASSSIRGSLFQARCFEFVVFNERDFVTVRDGLQVARRSSTQSLANPSAAEVTPSSEASTSSSSLPAANAPADPTNATTVPKYPLSPSQSAAATTAPVVAAPLEPTNRELPAPESSAKPSDSDAVVSRLPAAQANGQRTTTSSARVELPPLQPNDVSQAPPTPSQANTNVVPQKQPVTSHYASVLTSRPPTTLSSTQSKTTLSQPKATKDTTPVPPASDISSSARPKASAGSNPVPPSVQTTSLYAPPSASALAVSTSERVGSNQVSQHPNSALAAAPTQGSSAAPATTAVEAASTNVLKPRKKKIEFQYLRKSPNAIAMPNPSHPRGTQATWTASAGDVQPPKHSFVKLNNPPPVHKPARLGDCSPEFMQFMEDCCENDDPTDEENEDTVRRMQLQLLEVVDLTNLSDSDDRSDADDSEFMDDSRPTTPNTGVNTPSVGAKHASQLQTPVSPITDSNNAQTSAAVTLNRRGARPMETCVLCEERRWVKTLQHCNDCDKFYHKKCAREYGDENVCWNCELDGIIDDSELTETTRNEVLGMLSTFRHEPVDESNAESNGNQDGDGPMEDGEGERPVAESSGPHPLLSGAQTHSVQRWKAFLEWSTATHDLAFNETTNAIIAELQSEQHKDKYTNGFLTQEEFAASIGSVLDSYADLQERLDREREREREQLRQQNILAAANQAVQATSTTSGLGDANSNDQSSQLVPPPTVSSPADPVMVDNNPGDAPPTIPSQAALLATPHIPV